MLDLPKRQLKIETLVIRNPSEGPLVVWLEPWADRFELTASESLQLAFVGPKSGSPEVLPDSRETVVYGWEGSEVVALKDGRLATPPPTVKKIVQQEFDIAKEHVQRSDEPWPSEEIDMIDHKLDEVPELSPETQEIACDLTSFLICELAATVDRSNASTRMLWEIADRVVGTRGVVLAAADWSRTRTALWGNRPGSVRKLIWNRALSVLPGPVDLAKSKKAKFAATPQSVESESGPSPR